MTTARICQHTGRIHTGPCPCPTHTAARANDNRRRHKKEANHHANTRAWRRLRGLQLHLHPHCQLQHHGCTGKATTVHLAPRLNGNHAIATLRHLTSACTHCHGVEDAPRASRTR